MSLGFRAVYALQLNDTAEEARHGSSIRRTTIIDSCEHETCSATELCSVSECVSGDAAGAVHGGKIISNWFLIIEARFRSRGEAIRRESSTWNSIFSILLSRKLSSRQF